MFVITVGFAGLFAVLTIVVKYLCLLLNLNFRQQKYLLESIEKLQKITQEEFCDETKPSAAVRRTFWVLCALLVCLRLTLTGFQQAYIWGGAPLDDELMFRAANSITAGQWLGAYDYLTLSKAMFFPVWLALLHARAPAVSDQRRALWCGAALTAAFAFFRRCGAKTPSRGRVLTLALFAVLAFLPSSWASYTLRVYQDNIFPALCLYFLRAWRAWLCAPCREKPAALAVAGCGGRGPCLRLP